MRRKKNGLHGVREKNLREEKRWGKKCVCSSKRFNNMSKIGTQIFPPICFHTHNPLPLDVTKRIRESSTGGDARHVRGYAKNEESCREKTSQRNCQGKIAVNAIISIRGPWMPAKRQQSTPPPQKAPTMANIDHQHNVPPPRFLLLLLPHLQPAPDDTCATLDKNTNIKYT